MEIKIPDVPKDVIKQIRDGNCVVFVGAGLSQGAGLPNWTGLLHQMLGWAEEHGVDMSDRAELEKYIGEGKLLMVAEEMREQLVDDDFRRFMVETFRKPGLEPTDAHKLIPGIPFSAALTSNYDTLLETAYTLERKKTPPVFTHSDYPELAAALRSDEFYILKVHGHIDRIETIILGRSDYREIIHNNPAYHTYLTTLLSSKTILFVGFSLTDPDLMMLLDELGAIFQDYTGKHYALMNTKDVGDIERRRFERDYNIQIIPYTPSAEEHPEVRAFLSNLAELYETARVELAEPEFGKLSNVPDLPEHFLERPGYLNPIKKLLLAGDSVTVGITGKTRRIGVHGMGGIGKSVLAAALARDEEVRRAFPDGIIWLTIGQTPAITSRQSQLALALGDALISFQDEQQGRARLSEILADRECLIILDDVWKVEHAAAFNVLGEKCRMLITTRDAEIIRSLDAIEHRIGVLEDHDAMTLLARYAGQPVEQLPDEAGEVVRECGNLPLALAMIGSMVRRRPERWDNALHRLRAAELAKIREKFPDYEHPDLLKAIHVSVEALEPDVQPRYLDFAVFPEDTPVPEAVLQTFWEPEGLYDYDAQDVLYTLVSRSLAQRDDRGYWSLHHLQFNYVRVQLVDLSAFHNRLLGAYGAKCGDGWHTGPNDGYFFQHLCYHLLEAGREEELKELLLDSRWLRARLEATDVVGLISDYELLPDDPDLRLAQGAIRLSAHILTQDRTQLACQLTGRLLSHRSPEIQAMLERIRQRESNPWLRPLSPSLTPAGGPLIRIMEGHTGWVNSVTVTPDSRYAISGSSDKTLKVWDLETGEEIRTLKGHTDSVLSITVTPDGRYAISGSLDRTMKVWDLETGEEIQTLRGHTGSVLSVTVTPDGHAVSGSYDRTMKVWDLETGEEIRTLKGHTSSVKSVSVLPDRLEAISASDDRTVKVWNLETGEEIRTFKGHTAGVNIVTVTPDSRYAISGSSDKTLKVWDLETGEEIQTLRGHTGSVSSVSAVSEGERAISGSDDNTLKVWDLETGEEIQTLKGHTSSVKSVSVLPDRLEAISASDDRTMKVWDLETSGRIRSSEGHTSVVTSVSAMPDGRRVVSASYDKTLKLWDLGTRKEIRSLVGHTSIITSVSTIPDGQRAISASSSALSETQDKARYISTSSSDKAADRATKEWDLRAWDQPANNSLKVWNLETGEEIRTLKGHTGYVLSVTVTPDGRYAISGSSDKTLKVWDLETGEEIRTLKGHTGSVLSVAVTSDGRHAISGSSDMTLKVWDLETGEEKHTLPGHTGYVYSIAVTSDGRYAISGSSDMTLKVWDLETGEEVRTFQGHTDWVRSVVVTSDGRYAISASSDNALKVWDLETGSPVATFSADGPLYACAVAPDNVTIVTGGVTGRVHFLRMENVESKE